MKAAYKYILMTTILAAGLGINAASAQMAEFDPMNQPNLAFISVSGNVEAQTGDSFTLNYGGGFITVEMDDWDYFNEADWIEAGDQVTVRGEIDNDLYQAKTVEAQSVYVYDTSTFYYASDIDEEDSAYWTYDAAYMQAAPDGAWFGVSGSVKEIGISEFVLDTGFQDLAIETNYLPSDPLDNEGVRQLENGDRVYVTGYLDRNFFSANEIEAQSLVTINRDGM